VTRVRLRPAHAADTLADIYRAPHDHTRWRDHEIRVDRTIDLARRLTGGPLPSGADLSCGSGKVLRSLDVLERHFGDLAPGYQYQGPLEGTLEQIEPVSVYICTETLEHIDDPDAVLRQIRTKTQLLVLSTPIDAWRDNNVEHYWAWSRADVEEMLTAAGFRVELYEELDFRPEGLTYCYGIWGCR